MSSHTTSPEITHAPEHGHGTGRIWKVLGILSLLTVIELGLGYFLYFQHGDISYAATLTTKIVIGILTLAKAYYIVSVFMHLGDEIRNFIMTIIVPLCLFVWFIAAFLWDGNSWKNMRNTNAGSRKAPKTEQVQPAVEHGAKP